MRIPRYHLLNATPAELAEFWVTLAHELRMVGLEALNLPQFATRCDTCSGELLMVLPLTQDEAVLNDAIAAASAEWIPHWMRHIDLVSEMAIAMAKHRDEQEGVFQTFVQALKALPGMPLFEEEAVIQAASERAHSLLEEREWEWGRENGKLWVLREVPSRELPWILAEMVWETQLDDALTFMHIWRATHYIGIEGMANGYKKPPAITLMPFPVSVTGVGFELEANLEILERFRVSQKKNLEQNMLLLTDMLRGLRFGMSPYELMMRVSAVMPKPQDMDAVMDRVRKRRNKQKLSVSEMPEITLFAETEASPETEFLSKDDADALLKGVSTGDIDKMAKAVANNCEEAVTEVALPHSDFLTPEEVASLLAPVSKQKRKAAKRSRGDNAGG